MIIAYIILLALLLWGLRFHVDGNNDAYMSKDCTNVVKGLFIGLIFMKHLMDYVNESGYAYNAFGDHLMLSIQSHMGQLVVVMFLFYSGYGIMESYKHKGASYVKTMPRKRLLGTLLNFDVAVLLFIILNLILGKELTPSQCLLSLTAWDSVGNSNWYIFVILLCYLFAYISFRIDCIGKREQAVIVFLTLSLISYIILAKTRGAWWYDTFFCFSFGMVFSVFKEKIEKVIDKQYWLVLLAVGILFILAYLFPKGLHGLRHNAVSILFAMFVVILTRKIELRSRPLMWMGKNLFPLYIYQRISMMLFYEIDGGTFVNHHLGLYIIACALITFLFGYFYRYFAIKLK